MGIRTCALQTPAFAQLLEIYQNRERVAAEWKQSGKKVVAKLGFDVPDELVLAAGMMPVQVYADPTKELKNTDTYLEFAFDPMVRYQFEKLTDGTYAQLADHLAISNSTDVIIRIFLYLQEMRRMNLEQVPELTFIDWLFTRNRMHQERNELIVDLFMKELEKWSGAPLKEEAIREAMVVCNENRQALREMAELRHGQQVRISGTEALVIIGAAFFMDRKEHTALVRQVTEAAAQWPVLEGKRVFVTGSAQEDIKLYEMVEQTGAVIVGEDHDWGDRFYDRDCNLEYPVIRAIVDRYMLRQFSSKKAFVSQRVETLNELVARTGADTVLFYNNIYEEAASWDYPSQKKSLDEKGIASKSFVKMQYPIENNEGLAQAIAEFFAE